jgi:hypothetical protein
VTRGQPGDLLGEGRLAAVVGVAEEPPQLQIDDRAAAAHRLIVDAPPVAAVHPP